jgi:hypothetical protein
MSIILRSESSALSLGQFVPNMGRRRRWLYSRSVSCPFDIRICPGPHRYRQVRQWHHSPRQVRGHCPQGTAVARLSSAMITTCVLTPCPFVFVGNCPIANFVRHIRP